jgi:hypothetical protein
MTQRLLQNPPEKYIFGVYFRARNLSAGREGRTKNFYLGSALKGERITLLIQMKTILLLGREPRNTRTGETNNLSPNLELPRELTRVS